MLLKKGSAFCVTAMASRSLQLRTRSMGVKIDGMRIECLARKWCEGYLYISKRTLVP